MAVRPRRLLDERLAGWAVEQRARAVELRMRTDADLSPRSPPRREDGGRRACCAPGQRTLMSDLRLPDVAFIESERTSEQSSNRPLPRQFRRGLPIRVIGVQLGASLAGKLSCELVSISSQDDSMVWFSLLKRRCCFATSASRCDINLPRRWTLSSPTYARSFMSGERRFIATSPPPGEQRTPTRIVNS
jgi:hypothetical protein